MRMLALSTSGPLASAALLEDGKVIRQALGPREKTHSETFLLLAQEALGGLAPGDMDRFAVDIGPGSFTGVRIGVCGANALGFACGKPVTGVSSLAALAHGLEGPVCALLDCRNGNGYAMLQQSGKTCLPEQAVVVAEFLPKLPPRTRFVGDGAQVYKQLIQQMVPGATFGPVWDVEAAAIGLCAWPLEGAEEVMPLYLRPSQAERMRQEKEI